MVLTLNCFIQEIVDRGGSTFTLGCLVITARVDIIALLLTTKRNDTFRMWQLVKVFFDLDYIIFLWKQALEDDKLLFKWNQKNPGHFKLTWL